MKLLKCSDRNEIFELEDNTKHWVEDWDTFLYYANKLKISYQELLNDVNIIPFDELKSYKVGDTRKVKMIKEIIKGKDPDELFYPEPEKPYQFKGLRALLKLNPKPTAQQVKDLKFNCLVCYPDSALVENWNGNLISVANRQGTIMRYTGDERDCRNTDPNKEYETLLQMKKETPNIPVGFNLCDAIGCGKAGTYDTIAEYQKKWIEIANKADYISLNCYPYRPDWLDPIEKMEEFYDFWKSKIIVPIVPVIQAHWITANLTKPDPLAQIQFWFSKGLTGYIVYCWKDENKGVVDMQNEWKQANEWAKNNG